jgi:hypothetical protein
VKRQLARRTEEDIKRDFPIEDDVSGWFFRVMEASPGHYVAEGTDPWGRVVSHSGNDPDDLLARCKADARGIQETLTH